MADALSALTAAEARYDDEIPVGVREAIRFGSAAARYLLFAEGDIALYKRMALGQIRAIRARRADGSFFPAMLKDLAYYRRGFRKALRQRQAVRARMTGRRTARAA